MTLMFSTANFVAAKANLDQFEANIGYEVSKSLQDVLLKVFDTIEMQKFSDRERKVEVVNTYYQIENIQMGLLKQVSKENTKNEMIISLISQLERPKEDFYRYEYDFTEKSPDQITKEFSKKYGQAIAKSQQLDNPLNP